MSQRARAPAVAQVAPVDVAQRKVPDGHHRLQRHRIAGVARECSQHGQSPEIAGFEARVAVERNHFNCGSSGADAGVVTLALTNVQEGADELDLDALETHYVVEGTHERRGGGG